MAYEYITKFTSKNQTPGNQANEVWGVGDRKVSSITCHHWGLKGQKFDDVVNFLCTNNTPTSAHYVVEAGRVACIVDPDNCAWHSGNPVGNSHSIGIELRPEATAADYATAAELIRNLRAVYGESLNLIPHKQWSSTACPGDWDLAKLDKLARSEVSKVTVAAASKPAAAKPATTKKPAAKKEYVTLPGTAARWGVYRLGVAPVVKNIWNYIRPVQYGGITYQVLGWTVPNQVAIIQTRDFGKVQIFVGAGSGAKVFKK